MQISHPSLAEMISPILLLKADVEHKALTRLRYEELDAGDTTTAGPGPDDSEKLEFAMKKYAYYQCSKCKKVNFAYLKICWTLQISLR